MTVNGETRTFADGEGITFPKNMGGKRRFTVDRVEFAGYGLDAPGAGHMDFRGQGREGRGGRLARARTGPKDLDQAVFRRVLGGRNRYATEQLGAAASIGPDSAAGGGGTGGRGRSGRAGAAAARRAGGGRGAPLPAADFTTVQRLDTPVPPNVTANDAFFDVPLQPGAGQVRRVEAQGGGAGGRCRRSACPA